MSGAEASLGRQIKGPSAVGTDPRRFWHLTRALAVTEFKLRFFGSVLGYLWQLMRPLMLFGILYVLTGFGVTVGFYRMLTHRAFHDALGVPRVVC